jgi:hypothetical protein
MARNVSSPFARVLARDWVLGSGVGRSRRRQLLRGPLFPILVDRIASTCTVVRHRRKRLRRYPRYYRIEVTLKVQPYLVDLFHNSAAGYRAQYFRGTSFGEAANRYAVRQLGPRVMELLAVERKRTCPADWMKKSLMHPEAKVWIHQGKRLRSPSETSAQLFVRRWLKYGWDKKHQHRWARLIPSTETRLDLKGAALTLDGVPLLKRLKPHRSRQIYLAGYT